MAFLKIKSYESVADPADIQVGCKAKYTRQIVPFYTDFILLHFIHIT